MELQIKDTKATGTGCDCGCGGHDAVVSPATTEVAAAPACGCGPDCTCGCQEGQPCTCGTASAAPACGCGPDCTCGCQEGKPCTCGTARAKDAKDSVGLGADGAEGTGTYRVTGMTCGHCVKAITEEVSQLHGVTGVDIDLETGVMRVTSTDPIDFDRIVEAVAEAGDYTVE